MTASESKRERERESERERERERESERERERDRGILNRDTGSCSKLGAVGGLTHCQYYGPNMPSIAVVSHTSNVPQVILVMKSPSFVSNRQRTSRSSPKDTSLGPIYFR